MRKHLIQAFTFAALVISAASAQADDIRIDDPSYGGTGCPAGTVSTAVSPDHKELSILFDSYSADAGGNTGKSFDRKSCNIAIPVHVPNGYSVSLFKIDYRGFNSVPAGGRSQFNVEYFFADSRGPRTSKTFYGPQSKDFFFTNDIGVEAMVWSRCGADTILRVNTGLLVQTNSRYEQANATLDSADVSSALVYHFEFRRCP